MSLLLLCPLKMNTVSENFLQAEQTLLNRITLTLNVLPYSRPHYNNLAQIFDAIDLIEEYQTYIKKDLSFQTMNLSPEQLIQHNHTLELLNQNIYNLTRKLDSYDPNSSLMTFVRYQSNYHI